MYETENVSNLLNFLFLSFFFLHFFPVDKNKYCIVLRLDWCPSFYLIASFYQFFNILSLLLWDLQKTWQNNYSIDVMNNQFWKKPKYHWKTYLKRIVASTIFRSRFSCFFLFLLEVILFEWYWILNIRVPFLVKQTE
jgi:hypothetical protein